MRSLASLLFLVIASCSDPHAHAQPRPFDPGLVSPRLAGACEAFGSGGLDHAAAVGADAIAFAHTLEPRGPAGYATDGSVRTVEVRELSSFALRWRRVVSAPIYAIAASPDGSHVAVGTASETLVLDARDGRELARVDGQSLVLAFGSSGTLARGAGSVVTVHAPGSYARLHEHAITGTAPTVVHAMMLDGTCVESQEQTAAHVTALAVGADDAVYAGASDGSVRALGTTRRFDLPDAQARYGYATSAILLAPRARSIVSVWGDGRVVTLDAQTLRARAQLRGECSAADRSRVGRDCQGAALTATIAGDRIATPGRVRTLSGRSLAAMATHASESIFLAGEQLWLFGIDGTAERWSLDGGGRFLGYLPIPGRNGWVRDVSADGRYVALVGPRDPQPLRQLDRGEVFHVRVWDTRTERELAPLSRAGVKALFLEGGRVAIQGERRVEVLEVPSGRSVRAVSFGASEYAGLVAASGDRLVLMEDPGHARVVHAGTGASIDVGFGGGTVTNAVIEGDTLALLVFEAPPQWNGQPAHRLEVFSLAGAGAARLHRVDGVSEGAIELEGSSIVFVHAGVATRLDVASGRRESLAGAPATVRWLGRSGSEWIFAPSGGRPLLRAGAPFGPPALHIVRAQSLAHVTLLYDIGGAVYVVDRAGLTRGSIDSIDGGFVASSAAGHVSASPIALGALAVRDGSMVRACDPSTHRPALVEALLSH